MANKSGVVSIGLNVDYQKALQQMMNDFKSKLSTISNEAKKLDFSKDLTKQIGAVDEKIERISSDFKAMFDEINNQKLDSSKFESYQLRITKDFEKVEKSIAGVVSEISALDEKVGMLSGADFASGMKAQFDDLRESVLSTYQGLEKIFDLTKSSSSGLGSSALKDYKATVAEIRKAQKEVDNLDFTNTSDDDLFDRLSREEELLNKQVATFKELKAEMSSVSTSSPEFSTLENNLVRIQSAISKTSETIQALDGEIAARDLGAGMEDDTLSIINSVKHFDDEIDNFVVRTQKMIGSNKEAQQSIEQTQTSFNTFTIKNGAIHVPVEVATKSGTLQKQLQETIDKLQEYAEKNSIIAKVKLTLDKSSSKGYKSNSEIDKQQVEGSNEPALDFSGSINKAYRDATREAETIVKQQIGKIQKELKEVKIKLKLDDEALMNDLSKVVNDSLKKIAKNTTGLNVNQELEKLVANLKEVSTSLSGNENFKFGLDEASIERIATAIRDMADMIQRAFGVASNNDIAAQWETIKSKFKGVAGEEGKLFKGNKEHKIAIQELAVEYKKYLDMGGKNDLSELTTYKQTVKNIATEYENLGKAAQEAAKKQEKVSKKPASTKASSEEAEAIKSVTKQNKNLETQAGKTGAALDNEGKSAQSAAEKFRKLAKEKGAAVVANRELAKAAKETADALEREARIRKETGTKTGKGAVNPDAYAVDALKWQRDIRQSLMDSGNYEEVYGAKISQAANGVVKFTANVRIGENEWKKFTATVSDTGAISNPQLQDLTEKQVIAIEKAKAAWEKYVDAMASESEEPTFFNRAELESYIQTILEAEEGLERFRIKKVEINSGGKLAITTEFKEADGQVKTFVANFNSVEDIIDETTGSVRNLAQALESAFDSGKMVSATPKPLASIESVIDEIYETAHKLANIEVKAAGLDPEKDASKIQKLRDEYKDLEDVYSSLLEAFYNHPNLSSVSMLADSGKFSIADLNEIYAAADKKVGEINAQKKYQEIYEVGQKLADLSVEIEGLDSSRHSAKIQELTAQYRELEDVLDRLVAEFFTDDHIGSLPMSAIAELYPEKRMEEARRKYAEAYSPKAQKAFDAFEIKYQGNSNWSKVADEVDRLRQSIAGIDSQDKLDNFKQSLKDIASTLGAINKDNKLGEIIGGNRTFKDINEVRANIDSLFASMGKVNEKSIRVKGTDKLTAEVKAANGEIRKMTVSIDSNGFARFVDNGIVQFGRLRSAAEGVFKGIQSMVRIYLSPQDFIRYFRQGFDAVKEIDTAMTELKKVSDAPIGDIVAYFDDATESAKKLGSTVEDMISATADWSRLGYNLPDSRELGEVAVLYKNVGDGIDIDTANESLVSTIQGFQLQASDAMSVIDSFNEVSNNYAISSAGIGEALKRSAAAFNAANTDLNQSIALITAGNEIVQSPEKVGTMWQTVSARIRGTKSELEELGESTDDMLSSSKLYSLVKGYTGVDIMKDKDTYKDIYTIVSEIGEKWQDLTDIQRAALLEALAGKKQSNTLAAVLNNADRLKEIYETAEGSAGSAQREQERYAESLQYSLDQLTAHGEEFWNTFINKDDVKDFIDLINTLISGATKLVDTFGSIPTVAGILGGFAAIKNVGRPKMFGLRKYSFELPTIISVLSDTEVFLWSVVKYTMVNAR